MAHPSGLELLASPVRRRITDILANLAPDQRRHGLTATELAERLALHVTTVRFHVDQLVAGGLLLAHDVRSGVGRPRRHYAVDPGALPAEPTVDSYRLLAELLSENLEDELAEGVPISAEQAAERWVARHEDALLSPDIPREPARNPAQFHAKVAAVADLFERWGFRPSVRLHESATADIELPHCPLRGLAEEHPAVACGVHRGLVQAALARLGEPDAAVELHPFAGPDRCVARLKLDPTDHLS